RPAAQSHAGSGVRLLRRSVAVVPGAGRARAQRREHGTAGCRGTVEAGRRRDALARHRDSRVPPRAPSSRRAASASTVVPLLESFAVANYPHPIIAREGWLFIAIVVVVALSLTAGQYWILAALAWLRGAFAGRV